MFSHYQKAVLGEAHAIRVLEIEGRRKGLDLGSFTAVVAIRHGVHSGFARADRRQIGRRCHRHMAGVWRHCVQVNLEAIRHLDLGQVAADRVRILAGLHSQRYAEIARGHVHLLHGALSVLGL